MLGDRGGWQWLAVMPLYRPSWKPETTVRDNVSILISVKPLDLLTRLQDTSSCVYGNYTMFPLETLRNVIWLSVTGQEVQTGCLWKNAWTSKLMTESTAPSRSEWVCSWFVIRHYYMRYMQSQRKDYHGVVSPQQATKWALKASQHSGPVTVQPPLLINQIYHDDIKIIFCSEGIKKALILVLKILFTVSVLLEDLNWESVYAVKVINDAQPKVMLGWFCIIIGAESSTLPISQHRS